MAGIIFPVHDLVDALGHGAYGAKYAPGTWLVEIHGHDADDGRRQHEAVKTKGKLDNPVRKTSNFRSGPGHFEGPQKGNNSLQVRTSLKNKVSVENHAGEHNHEKYKETISEGLASEDFRSRSVS